MISIIIVNWNGKLLLERCLQSILKSEVEHPYEIIVVDNGSTDGSIELLTRNYPEIHLVCLGTNFGFARASNAGYLKSRGEYVLFLNNDVEVPRGCLDTMVQALESDPRIGLATCRLIGPDGKEQESYVDTPGLSRDIPRLFGLRRLFQFGARHQMRIKDVDAAIGAFLFCRRTVIEELKGFDEGRFFYGEDLDISYRCRRLGYRVVFVPLTWCMHVGGASTNFGNRTVWLKRFEAIKYFYLKHFPYWHFWVYCCMHILAMLLVRGPLLGLLSLSSKKDRRRLERDWIYLQCCLEEILG